jgi:hypothetical protein
MIVNYFLKVYNKNIHVLKPILKIPLNKYLLINKLLNHKIIIIN